MTQLEDRRERITSRLSRGLTKIDFLTYTSLLNEQRRNNPNHQKVYDGVPLSSVSFTPVSHSVLEILNENYFYISIVESKTPLLRPSSNSSMLSDKVIANDLYRMFDATEPSNGPFLYYEFVKADSNRDLRDWKYLYVPVSSRIESILINKLPSNPLYDLISYTYLDERPNKRYLDNISLDLFNKYYEVDTPDYSHPFLPYFFFNGRVGQNKEGDLLYEYFDSAGYAGPQDDLYISTLRPMGLDFPLGYYEREEIERDSCLSVGEYPVRGEVNRVGKSIGYKSNKGYNKLLTYFLYERVDGSALLLKEKNTSPLAEEFIQLVLLASRKTSPTLQLLAGSGSQSLIISQTSSNNQTINLG